MSNKHYHLLKKLINSLIKKGKKNLALKIFLITYKNIKYKNIYKLNKQEKNTYMSNYFIILFNQIKPMLYVKKIKKSSRTIFLPKILNYEQEVKIVFHWLLQSVNNRKEKKIDERLIKEIFDCYRGVGSTVTRKQKLYDVIILNRPFLNLLIYK